jgi:hypothetical protein
MRHYARVYGLTIVVLVLRTVPVHATPVDFFATLSGAAEVPANASPGTGFAHVTIDPALHTLHVQVTFGGLSAITIASHIHCCGPQDTNLLVATTTPTFPGFPLGVTSGTYDQTFDTTLASTYNPAFVTAHGGTTASAEADLFAGIVAGQSYLNIHTTAFPGGEIRGPLVTPEPGTLLLLSAGLASIAHQLWRRRRGV